MFFEVQFVYFLAPNKKKLKISAVKHNATIDDLLKVQLHLNMDLYLEFSTWQPSYQLLYLVAMAPQLAQS